VKQIMSVTRGGVLRRPLAVLVVAAGFTVAGCANNAGNASGTSPNAPAPPVVSSAPPAQPQPSMLSWTRSVCQALDPAFTQLGKPPQPDPGNAVATRQAFITYLDTSANAAQQAINRLSSIGAPPVDNGAQILDQVRGQLTQLRDNLKNAATQLKTANTNDAAAFGQAFGAASNVIGLLGTLSSQPQIRDAINQAPECQTLPGINAATAPKAPTSQPPS
jgi:hypothetical protein